VFRTADAKWQAVVAGIAARYAEGRPVLVGTTSVEASEHLSRLLTEAGIEHRVLNARQDRDEAETIAGAGAAGAVTVATNMAGRGTDIKLGAGVAERGGLHVIATERHDAGRIDRQLYGRCGRQGDPGSFQYLVSLEDGLIAQSPWRVLVPLFPRFIGRTGTPGRLLVRLAQRGAERRNARIRRQLLRLDEQVGRMLAFSGRME
jgi:preprotein translocase subunit SecA